MFEKPQEQHRWLEQLIGDWHIKQDCVMPDGTESQIESDMSCRMLGGLWLISEHTGVSEGGDWTCILTLGFDAKRDVYVGTFVGSMMPHLWQYTGRLDESGRRLPLDAQGPTFDGQGTTNYRDTIEIVGEDEWHFTSEMEKEDGSWHQLMAAVHRRK